MRIPCTQCGSTNTVLRDCPPGRNFSLRDILKYSVMAIMLPRGPRGRKYLVCKDCGHVSQIMLN